jgi:hypothetical protein
MSFYANLIELQVLMGYVLINNTVFLYNDSTEKRFNMFLEWEETSLKTEFFQVLSLKKYFFMHKVGDISFSLSKNSVFSVEPSIE